VYLLRHPLLRIAVATNPDPSVPVELALVAVLTHDRPLAWNVVRVPCKVAEVVDGAGDGRVLAVALAPPVFDAGKHGRCRADAEEGGQEAEKGAEELHVDEAKMLWWW